MVKFYLNRLSKKLPEERQDYLDTTVPAKFHDDVLNQWNDVYSLISIRSRRSLSSYE